MREIRVSAIISTLRRPGPLGSCLRTLREQTRKPDELVVIDAACQEEIRGLVESQAGAFPKVLYIPFPSSLTQARNRGIRESSGDVVVFIDDDLLLEPGFITGLLGPFERDPEGRVGGVTGDITNHRRGGEPLKKAFKALFMLPYDGDGRFRLSGAPTMAHGRPEERAVEFLPGGLTAWRRAVFSEFLFDESLPGLGVNEDVDFSYRVSRRWRNVYTPKARATHERPSLAREETLGYLRAEYESAWYLYRKNLPKDPARLLAMLWYSAGVGLRFLFRRFLRR